MRYYQLNTKLREFIEVRTHHQDSRPKRKHVRGMSYAEIEEIVLNNLSERDLKKWLEANKRLPNIEDSKDA